MVVDEINVFSPEGRMAVALQGQYCKEYTHEYYISIIKDICFLQSRIDGTVKLPAHKEFKYNGTLIGENTMELSMNKGDIVIFFVADNIINSREV